MTAATLIASVALGITFVASGVSKLRDLDSFVLGVLEYRVLPFSLAVRFARLLPAAECGCGALLIVGLWPREVGAAAATLLVSFVVAVAVNVARGRPVACHCFGSGSNETVGWSVLTRLASLLAAALVVAAWRQGGTLLSEAPDLTPLLRLALGALLFGHLLGTLPAQVVIWRARSTPAPTLRAGCVSYKKKPLPDRNRAESARAETSAVSSH